MPLLKILADTDTGPKTHTDTDTVNFAYIVDTKICSVSVNFANSMPIQIPLQGNLMLANTNSNTGVKTLADTDALQHH